MAETERAPKMNRANELLMVVYNFYCPKPAEMIKVVQEMEEELEPDEAIALTIAESLADGLQNGNWNTI